MPIEWRLQNLSNVSAKAALGLTLFIAALFLLLTTVIFDRPGAVAQEDITAVQISKNLACNGKTPGKIVKSKVKGAPERFIALNKLYKTKNQGGPLTTKQLKSVKDGKLQCKQFSTAETIYLDPTLKTTCRGKTYNVTKRSCTGKGAEAFRTAAAAMKRVGPGDTLSVRGGKYSGPIEITGAYTPGAPLLVLPQFGESVVIDGGGKQKFGIVVRASHAHLSGFELRNQTAAGAGVLITTGAGTIVSGVLITDGAGVIVDQQAVDAKVEGNVVRSTNTVGIRANSTTEIARNLIVGGKGDGISVQLTGTENSATIHHNIIISNEGVGIQADGAALIFNNTILGNGSGAGVVGINALEDSTALTNGDVLSQDLDAGIPNQIAIATTLSASQNAASTLFALAADSSAINAGQALPEFLSADRKLDFLGYGVSGNAPDLGAIEFLGEPVPTINPGGTGGVVPTIAPTSTPLATSTPTITPTSTLTPYPTTTPNIVDEMVVPPPNLTAPTEFSAATEFIYTGPNAVQHGVTPSTIKAERVAIMRGKVLGPDALPLAGVTVTVLNHPELGHTVTRAGGSYDLAVNGGTTIMLYFRKDGYLPSQRQAVVPVRDFTPIDDLMMVTLDPNVTEVPLGEITEIVEARGSVIRDGAGTRQGTILVKPGVTATMKFADGTSKPISNLALRVTEFTVGENGPKQMPGPLPPSSGYTYAAELSVDEAIAEQASSVEFSSPLPYYVENFLNFPIGMTVPVGYYDKIAGNWKASQNGRVIKILSLNGGSGGGGGDLAVLDVTGNGSESSAEDLAAMNITDAERAKLNTLYSAGQSVWRVELAHYTVWDCNWPFGPPPDAEPPLQPDPELDDLLHCASMYSGSIIECENQALGEQISIAGTGMALRYSSARVPGRTAAKKIKIPVSGASFPTSVTKMVVKIIVAGQVHETEITPMADQSVDFEWDGKDAYGTPVLGTVDAQVDVGYRYKGFYYKPGSSYDGAAAFALFSGIAIDGNETLKEVTLSQQRTISLGSIDFVKAGIGGWSLTPHHVYDSHARKILLGDGSERKGGSANQIIDTIAGNGIPGFSGDGGPAIQAQIHAPIGIAAAPDGTVYFADNWNSRIRKIDTQGIITTIAGNGTCAVNVEPVLATSTGACGVWEVKIDNNGALYFTSYIGHNVRRIDTNGFVQTIAGTGVTGFAGDGGPAINAQFNKLQAMAVGPDGALYLGDSLNHRLRRIGPEGMITTIAGTGLAESSGNGGPAQLAAFNYIGGIEVGVNGELYVTDNVANNLRIITPDGIVNAFAGTGGQGSSGDGGLATLATFKDLWGITKLPVGDILITVNNKIRRIDLNGIISTFAGNGASGSLIDGVPPAAAQLAIPQKISVLPDESILFVDNSQAKIRRIRTVNPSFSPDQILVASEDASELYVFAPDGRHQQTIDTHTNTPRYTFEYGAADAEAIAGRLTKIIDGNGNITTISYDSNGAPTAITAPFGQVTQLTVDANGYLASITDPASDAHYFTYSEDGLMQSMTDPRGNTSNFQYNIVGRLISDSDALGNAQTLSRQTIENGFKVVLKSPLNRKIEHLVAKLPIGDQVRTLIGADGNSTQSVEQKNGTVTTTAPDGTVTTAVKGPDPRFKMQSPLPKSVKIKVPGISQFDSGLVRSVTQSDPKDSMTLTSLTDVITVNGKVWTSVFNAVTKIFTATSPSGRTTSRTVDSLMRTTQVSVPTISDSFFSYDPQGRLVSAMRGVNADARILNFSYGAAGYLSSATNALDQTINYERDSVGRITAQTLPDGRQILFNYDPSGNLSAIGPPGQPYHLFQYSSLNQPIVYEPPAVSGSGDATTFTFNADHDLSQIQRPDQSVINFNYDLIKGRLTSVDGATDSINYFYDSAGRVSLLSHGDDGANKIFYSYAGQLVTSTVWSLTTGVNLGGVQRVFDNFFRVTLLTVNGINPISYGYDNDGLMTSAGGTTLTRHPQTGFLTATSILAGANQITENFGYSNFGEVATYAAARNGASLLEFGYTRDKLGRITAKNELIGGIPHQYNYSYDPAGRLIESQIDGAVTNYSYDENSNRVASGGVTATYDDQDQLLNYGDENFAYTQNGEISTRTGPAGVTSYSYDDFGALIAATTPNVSVSYILDPTGRRIGRKVNGVLQQGFLYQNELDPIAELDAAGAVKSRFVYGSRPNVPDYMIKGGITYKIVADHLGSTRLVVNTTNGAITQRLDYDAFGNIILDTNPGFQPFGFAGGIYDPDTKLTQFGAREYDPQIGRWITKDPIGFAGGDTNLYGYVVGDPINLMDLNGLLPGDWISNPGSPPPANLTEGSVMENVSTEASFSEGGLEPPTLGTDPVDYVAAGLTGWLRALQLAREMGFSLCSGSKAVPLGLMDQMVLDAAKAGAGKKLPIKLGDPRYLGMEKWQYTELSKNGARSTVHYVRNPTNGAMTDFKFTQNAETYK